VLFTFILPWLVEYLIKQTVGMMQNNSLCVGRKMTMFSIKMLVHRSSVGMLRKKCCWLMLCKVSVLCCARGRELFCKICVCVRRGYHHHKLNVSVCRGPFFLFSGTWFFSLHKRLRVNPTISHLDRNNDENSGELNPFTADFTWSKTHHGHLGIACSIFSCVQHDTLGVTRDGVVVVLGSTEDTTYFAPKIF
jgi:hypothetical protein